MPLSMDGGYFGSRNKKQLGPLGTLDWLKTQDPVYKRSIYPGMQLGIAQQFLNGRMAGAPQLENNISSTLGTNLDFIGKNATDASQALALGAGAGGQADEAYSDLQTKESQNKYAMLQNLNDAYAAMQNEDKTVFGDSVRRYEDLVGIEGAKEKVREGRRKRLGNTLSGIANLGVGLISGGAIKNPFGGGRSSAGGAAQGFGGGSMSGG